MSLTPPSGLTANYNPTAGTLTITGGGTAATYESALQSVKYQTTSQNPAPGIKTVTFQVVDSNAISSNMVSRKISVTPVNDAPSFTAGPNVSADEDDPGFEFIGWATNISAGPGEEQTTQIPRLEIVSVSNPELFSLQPFVNTRDGTLRFTSAANATGSSNVQVRARDDGGTANGGFDYSATQSFTITINEINDEPFAQPDAFVVTEDTLLNVLVPGVLGNDRDLEANPMTAIKLTDPLHGAVAFNANGSFTYTPHANFAGTDSFTYRSSDGSLQSGPTTITLSGAAGERRPRRGERLGHYGRPAGDHPGDCQRYGHRRRHPAGHHVYATDSRLPPPAGQLPGLYAAAGRDRHRNV